MKEPTTPEEVAALHRIMQSNPQRYLKITNEWIAENPQSSTAYFDRHQVWMKLGEPQKALDDLNKSIELNPKQTDFWSRGDVYRHIGDYEKARADYGRAEAIDPGQWERDAFPLLYQADVHARLGDETAASACCARLPEHFWTPGPNGLPPGGKAEIGQELSRRAAAARARKGQ
jgi:tetratricopeptide (TPR) repeat protein